MIAEKVVIYTKLEDEPAAKLQGLFAKDAVPAAALRPIVAEQVDALRAILWPHASSATELQQSLCLAESAGHKLANAITVYPKGRVLVVAAKEVRVSFEKADAVGSELSCLARQVLEDPALQRVREFLRSGLRGLNGDRIGDLACFSSL
eukprot:9728346-Lingulodinium_polyedra.AAC.1